MNFLKLTKSVYAYLGFHSYAPDAHADGLIEECLKEVEKLSRGRNRQADKLLRYIRQGESRRVRRLRKRVSGKPFRRIRKDNNG